MPFRKASFGDVVWASSYWGRHFLPRPRHISPQLLRSHGLQLAAGELPKSNSNSKFQIRIPNSNSRCDLVSTRFESGHGPFSNFQNTVYLIYTAYTIYLICTAYTIYTAYTVYLILVISYIRHIQSPVVY